MLAVPIGSYHQILVANVSQTKYRHNTVESFCDSLSLAIIRYFAKKSKQKSVRLRMQEKYYQRAFDCEEAQTLSLVGQELEYCYFQNFVTIFDAWHKTCMKLLHCCTLMCSSILLFSNSNICRRLDFEMKVFSKSIVKIKQNYSRKAFAFKKLWFSADLS